MALFAVLQTTFLLALLPLRTYQSEGKKWKEQERKKNHIEKKTKVTGALEKNEQVIFLWELPGIGEEQ